MPSELVYRIALTQVPQIGTVQARILVEKFGSAQAIFEARRSSLEQTEGIGSVRAAQLRGFRDFSIAETEAAFLERYNIKALFLTDPDYPSRLLHCYDPPTLLYYKGTADLNATRTIAIIGTRNNSEYGKQLTEKLLAELQPHNITVISGLAFGIDAIAHRQALVQQLPTVGVLAHGLDHIYPLQHQPLARQMVKEGGGLLTEFCSYEGPDKHHFPVRNRIVAGLSDAVVVVESGQKGGSMVTAELANGYNKEVFCFPGRTTDPGSAGCNLLIREQKAQLITKPAELVEAMGWNSGKTNAPKQAVLPLHLSASETALLTLLQQKEVIHLEELLATVPISSGETAAALLSLEMQGLVKALPGKQFRSA